MVNKEFISKAEAARQICLEARIVLCSLRGGPPLVARGELSHDLQDLRVLVRAHLEDVADHGNVPEVAIDEVDTTLNTIVGIHEVEIRESETVDVEQTQESTSKEDLIQNQESTSEEDLIQASTMDPLVTSNVSIVPHSHVVAPPPIVSPLDHVGLFARPFLAVVMDHRAAGPHTLVALRALHRLVLGNYFSTFFPANFQAMMEGILLCKFEQTDAGADEAVELAICDLLTLLVELDTPSYPPLLLLEAFSNVFMTRNSLSHSPALLLHLDRLLVKLCEVIFYRNDLSSKLVMGFLTSNLSSSEPDQHSLFLDSTRVLCLKLAKLSFSIGWDECQINAGNEFLSVIQDDLCLSLLMIGQSIWAQSPGSVSLELVSEVCSTITAFWHVQAFQTIFCSQLEAFLTGFYQRALVLLRKRPQPLDSVQFNENLIFDAEVEVILESLVDFICLEDKPTLEILFRTYDCSLKRVDVMELLLMELSRCCGTNDQIHHNNTLVSRPVPPHLKELCAEAILGYLKTLFQNSLVNLTSCDSSSKSTGGKEFVLADPELSCEIQVEGECGFSTVSQKSNVSHRIVKARKRKFQEGAQLFNEDSSKGIDFLVKNEMIKETPADVALFLRNGLVLGLDKACVGIYLGEIGKPASPGKNRPCWERDWFHKEVLGQFCSLFRFENQTLLEGLRMFLTSFRLPGESQQIDRIIQSFADSCGRKCDEAVKMKIFSEDPKRASDTAFLLAFSIIMLNTDRHNKVIKEEKKMSKDAFVKNNTDYGRDITEQGKELPREFLENIYDSISEEEIRTEAEGAEGIMTVDRWKDILRGSTAETSFEIVAESESADLKELIVENIWRPIVSVIGAFWGTARQQHHHSHAESHGHAFSGMLSAQGARLGMDIALEVLAGARGIGRIDIFQQIFSSICFFTGLLGEYNNTVSERAASFINSVEAQSAVIVCVRVAQDAGKDIGLDGWMQLWAIILELRDLKLLFGRKSIQGRSIFTESDTDLLNAENRREWKIKMAKGSFDDQLDRLVEKPVGFFGSFGRALFGSPEKYTTLDTVEVNGFEKVHSIHGKDELTVWDELAASDDEEDNDIDGEDNWFQEKPILSRFSSPGASFESHLIHEDLWIQDRTEMPVTGLERVDDSRKFKISPRARARRRLARACDFTGLIHESRFMALGGTVLLLKAIINIISIARKLEKDFELQDGDSRNFFSSNLVLSPASEALAEVLICEIAILNRDRLGALWSSVLESHYSARLNCVKASFSENEEHTISSIEPGTEKCVTGLLRLCVCASQKKELANKVISALSFLPIDKTPREIEELDKHISEGLWRICSSIDGFVNLDSHVWVSILELMQWCALRTGKATGLTGLTEGDPGLQTYRCLLLILECTELCVYLPSTVINVISKLAERTNEIGCTKLCLASLDLLHIYQSALQVEIYRDVHERNAFSKERVSKWMFALTSVSDVAWSSRDPVVRSHSMSVLTDAFLDKQGSLLPPCVLRLALPDICIRFATKRITALLGNEEGIHYASDDIMIEFEQSVSLIFKPFLNHAKSIVHSEDSEDLDKIWSGILDAMENLLQVGEDERSPANGDAMSPGMLRWTLKELACEHLRNVIMILHAHGVLNGDPSASDYFSEKTWKSIDRMTFCNEIANEWKSMTRVI